VALCGTTLSDVNKDADCGDDHSLDNIVAFSTMKQLMCAPSKEGPIIRDENARLIDPRTKICYDDKNFLSTSYSAPCQITATVPPGKKSVGSGYYIATYSEGVFVFITCNHNFVSWSSRRKSAVPFENMRVYGRRDGLSKWYFLSKSFEKKILHPKYNGQPDCGYGLGITEQSNPPVLDRNFQKLKPERDSFIRCKNPKDETKGMTIELIHYAGVKKSFPLTQAGKILDITHRDLGGWALWYNADATPGNSGSAIHLTNVHSGHDEAEGYNFETLLAQSLQRWISKELKLFI